MEPAGILIEMKCIIKESVFKSSAKQFFVMKAFTWFAWKKHRNIPVETCRKLARCFLYISFSHEFSFAGSGIGGKQPIFRRVSVPQVNDSWKPVHFPASFPSPSHDFLEDCIFSGEFPGNSPETFKR